MSGRGLEGVDGIEALADVQGERPLLLSSEMRRLLVAANRPGTTIQWDWRTAAWVVAQGHFQWDGRFAEATVNALWGEGLIGRVGTGLFKVYSITDAGRLLADSLSESSETAKERR